MFHYAKVWQCCVEKTLIYTIKKLTKHKKTHKNILQLLKSTNKHYLQNKQNCTD